jgi:hypothetical protein
MLLNGLVGFLASIAAGLVVNRIEAWFARRRGTQPAVAGSRSVLLTATCAGALFFVLYSLDQRWATSRPQGYLVFTVALLLLLVAATARQLLGTRWLLPGLQVWALDLCFVVLVVLVAYSFDSLVPHEVSLELPRVVGPREVVTGSVAHAHRAVFVVVRPEDSSRGYVFRATGPDAGRSWSAFCEFGGATGETYLVTAYAVDQSAAPVIDTSDRPEFDLEVGHHAQSRHVLVRKR